MISEVIVANWFCILCKLSTLFSLGRNIQDSWDAVLQALVKNDGIYRLKLTAQSLDGRKTEVATFVKAVSRLWALTCHWMITACFISS